MKSVQQMRDDALAGARQARSAANDIRLTNGWMADALTGIAAEAERAAKSSPNPEVLLVAIGKLAGALSLAAAYQRRGGN